MPSSGQDERAAKLAEELQLQNEQASDSDPETRQHSGQTSENTQKEPALA